MVSLSSQQHHVFLFAASCAWGVFSYSLAWLVSASLSLFFKIFIYLLLALLGLHCCAGSSLVQRAGATLNLWCVSISLWWFFFGTSGFRHMGFSVVAPGLKSTGSVVMENRLCCPLARGIFPDQGLNPCLLHWQADSLPLSHQGSPWLLFEVPDPPASLLDNYITSAACPLSSTSALLTSHVTRGTAIA